MRLGRFEIYPILDGFFGLDGGAMFGRVPREVWKKTNPPDEQNRILLALRCLLIQTGKHNILVDTGIGDKYDEKFAQRYAINRENSLLDFLLHHNGFSVDIVINTHLHFDHCGGNTAFPRTKHFIQVGEWQEAVWGSLLTRASYIKENFLPIQNRIEFINEKITEIEPGITLIKTGGHTKDHQIVQIESESKKAIYLGDLVPTATHLKYPFIMGYDVEPLETLKKKIEILTRAVRERTLLIFEHEPKFDAAFVEEKDGKISIIEGVVL